MKLIRIAVYSTAHPWRMGIDKDRLAFNIAARKIKNHFGVKLTLANDEIRAVPEPSIDQDFQYESQVAGYMLYKLKALYPPKPEELALYLIRPVVKTATNGAEIRMMYGAAEAVCRYPGCAASGCAEDFLRKAPTPYYLAGLMMAHEVSHLLGARHDNDNMNIMNTQINNYSRYRRWIGFNLQAKRDVKGCLQS